jgi:hypothetical protein
VMIPTSPSREKSVTWLMADMAKLPQRWLLAAGATKNQAPSQESSRFRRTSIKQAIRSARAAGL